MSLKSKVFQYRVWVYSIIAVLLVLLPGCRQDPETTPKYYEAEIRAMEREAVQRAAEKDVKFLEDRHPWEGKTKNIKCLPCRITNVEKPLEQELDYLHTFIHGKKRTKPRLRD